MQITCSFDGGNIQFIGASSPDDIRLEIRNDSNSDFYQWFFFRVSGAKEMNCGFKIMNAGGASYPEGWRDYRVCVSYDRKTWFRVPTTFDGEVLAIAHQPREDSAYYAYFPPYSMERHADLIAQCVPFDHCALEVLGATLDGQDMDLLVIGDAGEKAPSKVDGRKICWVIARQHPGETQAEWWMEGFLRRLLDKSDPISRALLQRAVFYVVPNMNPDGGKRGNLRTNAAGANLNREWDAPTVEKSPEVYLVKKRMAETGCDFFLDVHGDEAIPYNFIANAFGIPSLSDRQRELTDAYKGALRRASPDFQTEFGYPENAPGKANLSMASNSRAETFGCLSLTLEMPFKDNVLSPDQVNGWSPKHCRKLGAANLDAIYAVIDNLR